MTQISLSPDYGNISYSNRDYDQMQLRDSIADIINVLTGTNRQGSKLGRERISEDLMFAALVHSKLKENHPDLADRMLKQIPPRFKRLRCRRERQPLFEAVSRFLKNRVAGGMISEKEAEQIKRFAFGKAQLDQKGSRLRRRMVSLAESSEAAKPEENIKKILDRADRNNAASAAQIRRFTGRLERLGTLTRHEARRRKGLFKKIDAGDRTAAAEPELIETDRPAELPQSKDVVTGAGEFVYKSVSQKDGNALIMLPLAWSDNLVDEVSVYSPAGEELAVLNYSGKGDDGRDYWRWNKPGRELGDNITVYMHRVDGLGRMKHSFSARSLHRLAVG